MGLPDKAKREKRAKFRELAKSGQIQTGRQYEERREQLELDFEPRRSVAARSGKR